MQRDLQNGAGVVVLESAERGTNMLSSINPTGAAGMANCTTPPPVVWTGSRMIVWDGPGSSGSYDPVADTWTPITASGAPSVDPCRASIVWTGTDLIVWGGNPPAGARWQP